MINKYFYIILVFGLVFISCGEEPVENPYDPGSGDYDPPETTILSGPDGITQTFEGNDLVTEFSYRLDIGTIQGTWSDWSAETTVSFINLDEGAHTFNVKGRYSDVDEDASPATATFTIDAVTGPSIRFFPRSPSASINSVFSVDVVAEEVEGVSGIEVELEFDDAYFTKYGDLIQGTIIADEIVIQDISDGRIKVTIGITAGSDGQNLTGTETLFSLFFTAIKEGSSEITFNSVQFRDQDNNIIEINETIDSMVTVE